MIDLKHLGVAFPIELYERSFARNLTAFAFVVPPVGASGGLESPREPYSLSITRGLYLSERKYV